MLKQTIYSFDGEQNLNCFNLNLFYWNEYIYFPCCLSTYEFRNHRTEYLKTGWMESAHQSWDTLSNAEYIGNGNSMSNSYDDISNCLYCLHWTKEEESEKQKKCSPYTPSVYILSELEQNRVSEIVNPTGISPTKLTQQPLITFYNKMEELKIEDLPGFVSFMCEIFDSISPFGFFIVEIKRESVLISHTFLTAWHEYEEICC